VTEKKWFAEKVHSLIVFRAMTKVLGGRIDGVFIIVAARRNWSSRRNGKSGKDGAASFLVVGGSDYSPNLIGSAALDDIDRVILFVFNNTKRLLQRIFGGREISLFKESNTFVVECGDKERVASKITHGW
jgi:hypothetical protein